MPIDTSSYYPEVKGPEDNDDWSGLNKESRDLFGSDPNPESQGPKDMKEEPPQVHVIADPKENPGSGERIVTFFAKLISWLLSPMLMPAYGLIFIFGLSVLDVVAPGMRIAFIFIIFGINFVIPFLLILLLRMLGEVSDFDLTNRKERLVPYFIGVVCLGVSAWFMAMRGAPLWVTMFFAGGGVAALLNLIINFWWKISAHAAGIAGLIALLIRLEKDVAVEPRLFVWLLITIGATGLLGSCRIWLGRHDVWQVLAGYAVGFCSVFFLMSV